MEREQLNKKQKKTKIRIRLKEMKKIKKNKL